MSCVYKGQIIETDLSKHSRGGTELVRSRLLRHVEKDKLENFAIHFSRPRELYKDVKNIFYAHDLAEDPENRIFDTNVNRGGHSIFDHFVFVSEYQRTEYLAKYKIPFEKTSVIQNAVEFEFYQNNDQTNIINFIYHTTPHRGLEVLYTIFDHLCKFHSNIHLHVYSSFEIYGWKERDHQYKILFEKIKTHPKMTYYGSVENSVVLKQLEKTDVFLYPCIWKETSCLALIEAMMKNCICIHPNYGALQETANSNTLSFELLEQYETPNNTLLRKSIELGDYVIKNIHTIKRPNPNTLTKYSIGEFTNSWNNLLNKLAT